MTPDPSVPARPPRGGGGSLSAELLERYGARRVTFAVQGTVFDQGDPARHLHAMVSGRVRMVVVSEKGQEFTQGFFRAGETFGEPPLLLGGAYPASAVAVEESVVLKCPRAPFLKLLRENPDAHLAFTRVLAQRLVYKSMMLGELATGEAEHRLSALLGYFRKSQGAPDDQAWRVPFTRQQLADMTGLRVETVIRTIKSMEEKGRLRIQAGRVLWNPAHEPDRLDDRGE